MPLPPSVIARFAYGEIGFTKAGLLRVGSAAGLLDVDATDVLILAHGWNETVTSARDLYGLILAQVRGVLGDGQPPAAPLNVAVVGVQWPSMILTGDVAAGVDGWRTSVRAALPSRFQPDVDELFALLDARPASRDDVVHFMALLRRLAGAVPGARRDDDGDRAIVASADPFFDLQALVEPQAAAGFADVFDRVWRGAREALRATTFWQMKRRAATTGALGLGPLLADVALKRPEVRLHLIGHSFGARLVANALPSLSATSSNVASMTLLQGAFSHFAFAERLPQEPTRRGQLAGMESRVRGPIVATHTRADTALSTLYPLAARMSGDDAADVDRVSRFGALGADGAQLSGARATKLLAAGAPYALTSGHVTNVDANAVMNRGGPPDGAHSDLGHPEVGWLIASAAGLRRPKS